MVDRFTLEDRLERITTRCVVPRHILSMQVLKMTAGGKTSNFQGGIRVNAFVSGGVVPLHMRGSKLSGLSTVWDWYATFADIAQIDTTDHVAASAGLPAIDSISLWPWLSGKVKHSPRHHLAIGSSSCVDPHQSPTECVNKWGWGGKTIVTGLIQDEGEQGIWKLLLGKQTMDGWQGVLYPNTSTAKDAFTFTDEFTHDCGDAGCLFRIDTDAAEHHDLRNAFDARADQMLTAIVAHNHTVFSPDRGPGEQDGHITEACSAAVVHHRGFFGPFVNL